jgi:hypothetical protein
MALSGLKALPAAVTDVSETVHVQARHTPYVLQTQQSQKCCELLQSHTACSATQNATMALVVPLICGCTFQHIASNGTQQPADTSEVQLSPPCHTSELSASFGPYMRKSPQFPALEATLQRRRAVTQLFARKQMKAFPGSGVAEHLIPSARSNAGKRLPKHMPSQQQAMRCLSGTDRGTMKPCHRCSFGSCGWQGHAHMQCAELVSSARGSTGAAVGQHAHQITPIQQLREWRAVRNNAATKIQVS